jgi:uncharacterized protein YggU (UPF0235/DUF167 family)
MDLELVETPTGTRLRLRVRAGARKNALLGPHAGALKLSVTTAPEKGKANRAVIALLAGVLELPASAIEIVAGATSPDKVVMVELPAAVVRKRLSLKLG